MAYFRVNIMGSLGDQEKWSVNPQFATSPIVAPSVAEMQKAADNIAAVAVGTALSNAKSSQAPITTIRVEYRDDDGTLLLASQAAQSGSQATGNGATAPGQTAVVLSLRTDVPGASGRGRLYWPALGIAPTPGGLRIPSGTQVDIATGAVTYLRAVQDALKAGIAPAPSAATFELAVFSKTKKTHAVVRRILVGNVFDTQRRRRDALVESYVTRAFPS